MVPGMSPAQQKKLALDHMNVKWGTKSISFTKSNKVVNKGIRLVRWTLRLRGPTDTSSKEETFHYKCY